MSDVVIREWEARYFIHLLNSWVVKAAKRIDTFGIVQVNENMFDLPYFLSTLSDCFVNVHNLKSIVWGFVLSVICNEPVTDVVTNTFSHFAVEGVGEEK